MSRNSESNVQLQLSSTKAMFQYMTKSAAISPPHPELEKESQYSRWKNSFVKEDIFATEPAWRLTSYVQKVLTSQHTLKRFTVRLTKVYSIACRYSRWKVRSSCRDTPRHEQQLQAFIQHNYGSSLYQKQKLGKNGRFWRQSFFLVLELISIEEATKSLTLFPKLTQHSLTRNINFSKAPDHAIEFFIGERFSQVFRDSARNISENSLLYWLLVNTVTKITRSCSTTVRALREIWSGDNFRTCRRRMKIKSGQNLHNEARAACKLTKFRIFNSSPTNQLGQHWLLMSPNKIAMLRGFFAGFLGESIVLLWSLSHQTVELLFERGKWWWLWDDQLKTIDRIFRFSLFVFGALLGQKPLNIKLNKNHIVLQATKIDARFSPIYKLEAQNKYKIYIYTWQQNEFSSQLHVYSLMRHLRS